jgi:riboflavin synthase
MFTGIIEQLGVITHKKLNGTNVTFGIDCPITTEFKVDQSIAHNGVCLTIEKIVDNTYFVTAIKETLDKTNVNQWEIGTIVNLERALKADQRLDGHFVQGHVDTVGTCIEAVDENGSWRYTISYASDDPSFFTVPKGSISVNGVSLTVATSKNNAFEIAIIPFTYEHTNFKQLRKGDSVNLEFDILGKYITGLLNRQKDNLS